MITLAHLHALMERALTHTENTAIRRLNGAMIESYLSRTIHTSHGALGMLQAMDKPDVYALEVLDLTDPGTAHALLVALALALGHDPGPMALEVMLSRIDQPARRVNGEQEDPVFGWFLYTTDGGRAYYNDAEDLAVCAVAAEPDPIKALGLAVLHVLENP